MGQVIDGPWTTEGRGVMGQVVDRPWTSDVRTSTRAKRSEVWGVWADWLEEKIRRGESVDAVKLRPLLKPMRYLDSHYRKGQYPLWLNRQTPADRGPAGEGA